VTQLDPAAKRDTEVPGKPGPRAKRGFPVDLRLAGLFGVLVLIIIIGYITRPDAFLSDSNISTVLRQASAIGVVSVGMTFVIISGGIDLSVGSMVGLSSVWMTTLATQSYGPWIMVLCGLGVGLAAGLVNGVLIAYGRMVPFIATLAMFIAASGLAERISGRQTQVVRDQDFLTFFLGDFLGVPALIWIFAIVVAIGWVVLNRTTFGRHQHQAPHRARLRCRGPVLWPRGDHGGRAHQLGRLHPRPAVRTGRDRGRGDRWHTADRRPWLDDRHPDRCAHLHLAQQHLRAQQP
jgi:ribose transport system permease protein